MEFRILGPLEVRRDGVVLPPVGPKQRALLALLLLHANEPLGRTALIDGIWGEHPPETAAKALQVYVSELRRTLGREVIHTRGGGYELAVAPDELDLSRFERLIEEARAAGPAAAAPKLRTALALWRGPALGDVSDAPFARAETGRLEELRLAAAEELADAELALGHHSELVPELERLVAHNPLRERPRAQLILALYRSGRQAEALECYQEARRLLVQDLGIDPGRPLRELETAILRQDPDLDFVSIVEDGRSEASAGVFVGRRPELDQLLAALDDVLAHRGRVFLLAGEPGIGKSRFAEEVIRRARERGFDTLVGRCWEAGGAPAYWPWVQSLRLYVRATEPATLQAQLGPGAAEIAHILPELHELLPGLAERTSVDSEGARFRLFDAAAEFLRTASERRPIAIVLDDLHAADTPSLLLLQFLAREIAASRVLLVGAFRDVDPVPGDALAALLAEVAREPVSRRLYLGRLSEEDVATYLESTAPELASADLAAALYRGTEGNPLFLSETVRLLSLEGGGVEPTGKLPVPIPPSLRDVILRRLGHLPDECRRVLSFASVLGREFALDALARIVGVTEEELLDTLEEAVRARVVSDVPEVPGHLRFAHVLIRDTLYEAITAARRVQLHRRVVEALETLHGDDSGLHLAELAHHAIAGRDFDQGRRNAQRAGDRALALVAYEEAGRLYHTALDALARSEAPDEEAECELLLSLGEAEIRAGNTSAAKRAFLDAASLARRLGLARQLARAAVGYGGRIVFARAGDDDRLVPLLEEGLAALEEDDVELRARLLARLAGALRDEPSRERREKLSREAVELARRSGNPAALAAALEGRAVAIIAPDTVDECLAVANELQEVAEQIGDAERMVQAHMDRCIAQLQVGNVSRAKSDLDAANRIADELKQPAQQWAIRGVEAMLALATGRFREGEGLVAQTFALGERAQPEMAIPVHRLQLYTLCDFRGTLEKVEPAISDLVREYPERPVFRCVAIHLQARLRRLPEAERALAKLAADDFSALPFDQEWLLGMSLLAEASALLRETDSASVLYRLLVPWAALNVVDQAEGMRGSVSRYLGILATTTTRWDEADRHFGDAVAMNERMGARPWVAHTQHDHAHMLLARDRAGDRMRARQLLDTAFATYRELGMSEPAVTLRRRERLPDGLDP